MTVQTSTRFLSACALAAAAFSASAQEISLRAGESADLHPVYWVANCKSILNRIAGVDLLEGPPGIEVSIRAEQVFARRQNCQDKVPGGIVVLSVKNVESTWTGNIKYRVRYETEDGDRQSSHSKSVSLYAN